MKRRLEEQRGITLPEVVVGILLMIIIIASMVNLFSQSLLVWTTKKNALNMEENARIAVDTMVREIRYSQEIHLNHSGSLQITKLNGEINTFQLGSGAHASTLYIRIDKHNAIPIGSISANPITENVVTTLLFTPYPEGDNIQAVLITLEVMNQQSNKKYLLHTAGYPWNSFKTLLY